MKKEINNVYKKRFLYFNVYVIKGDDGDILIDTGFIFMRKRLKKWLDQFNIKLIILTHAHVDHIWNASYLQKEYNCEIAISKADEKNIDNKNIKTKPLSKKFKLWTKLMSWGMKNFKAEEFKINYLLEEKEKIKKYGLELEVIPLPGHTLGSIGIKYKDNLFVGDALVNRGKVTLAFQNEDNELAAKSFNTIKELNAKKIFFGHDKEKNY